MANRVGSYFPKGGHSAAKTELNIIDAFIVQLLYSRSHFLIIFFTDPSILNSVKRINKGGNFISIKM